MSITGQDTSSLAPRAAGGSNIVNGMSVDVEEYFHVSAFLNHITRDQWATLPSRVEGSVDRSLALFDQAHVRATFFILGWVAERFPQMIREIAGQGHEIASHGCNHVPAYQQTPAEFRADVRHSKQLLEDIAGCEVKGYRAASFSIVESNQWAFAEIRAAGYRYSSSVVPIAHDIYGLPSAPRFRFTPEGTDLLECPVTTTEFAGRRWPCGGGGYFRLLPYPVFRAALRRVHARDGQACFFYLHPWELDPEQPRIGGARLRSRFRHYQNLSRTEPRLVRLLQDFRWNRYDAVLGFH